MYEINKVEKIYNKRIKDLIFIDSVTEKVCEKCKGAGVVIKFGFIKCTCPRCEGQGKKEIERK